MTSKLAMPTAQRRRTRLKVYLRTKENEQMESLEEKHKEVSMILRMLPSYPSSTSLRKRVSSRVQIKENGWSIKERLATTSAVTLVPTGPQISSPRCL